MTSQMAPEEARSLRRVILASSAGTLIEWYDFYLFGVLATILASNFFPADNDTAGFLKTLATFAAGFVVRPFGSLVFGRMGDLVGRKVTFLLTLVLMGGSTIAIGLLPTYQQAGVLAPILLVTLRLVQGLALGGEYGGAAVYVAEHAPVGRRGFYTSFIQTTATLGLAAALTVILVTRQSMGEATFSQWGWRIPFLLSGILVIVSYFIRRSMHESPLFKNLQDKGEVSKNPLRESFVQPENRRLVLLALFGATAGQGVVWYTGQFYAMTFLEKSLHINPVTVNYITGAALLLATPLFVVFAHLSDRVGRLKLMMTACILAALLYVPIYSAKLSVMKPSLGEGSVTSVSRTTSIDPVTKLSVMTESTSSKVGEFSVVTKTQVTPDKPHRKVGNAPPKRVVDVPFRVAFILGALIFAQVVLVTMVYGPIAAFLVEMFPTRIRYTSMSLPYHLGNGIFGGLVPFIATALQEKTGSPLGGLAYPIAVAAITAVVGLTMVKHDQVHVEEPPVE